MHALLWSQSQNAFHVEPLERACENGQRAFTENRRSDYVLMAVGDPEEVQRAADKLRQVLLGREFRNTAARVEA